MKRTVFALLIVAMVATPCFTQEIEPDGLFSINNTRWEASFSLQISPFFPFLSFDAYDGYFVGFSGGEVYPDRPTSWSFYVDLGITSIFMYRKRPYLYLVAGRIVFGMMQPIGIGMMIEITQPIVPYFPTIAIVFLTKTDDNWTPQEPEIE